LGRNKQPKSDFLDGINKNIATFSGHNISFSRCRPPTTGLWWWYFSPCKGEVRGTNLDPPNEKMLGNPSYVVVYR